MSRVETWVQQMRGKETRESALIDRYTVAVRLFPDEHSKLCAIAQELGMSKTGLAERLLTLTIQDLVEEPPIVD